MTMSGLKPSRAAAKASRSSTQRASISRPPRRRVSSASSRSAGWSSTKRTRSGPEAGSGAEEGDPSGLLIEEEPVVAELADGLHELVEVHGLDDVAVRAEPVA